LPVSTRVGIDNLFLLEYLLKDFKKILVNKLVAYEKQRQQDDKKFWGKGKILFLFNAIR
jgi:hypothetical protein